MTFRVILDGRMHTGKPEDFSQDLRDEIAVDGVFLCPDDEPVDPAEQRRRRLYFARSDVLRGVSDAFVENAEFDAVLDEPRWVIPGLWRWGTIPLLTGQPKAGKTHFGTELATALVTPGSR
ncbi:MAG: AAA family ATPase, partial [Leifsonia sp.]